MCASHWDFEAQRRNESEGRVSVAAEGGWVSRDPPSRGGDSVRARRRGSGLVPFFLARACLSVVAGQPRGGFPEMGARAAPHSRGVSASSRGEAHPERTRWDPKDGELCLVRTKSGETLMEVRSDSDVQIDRRNWV
jgi:hypothetical protein